ncbi:MAG: cobalt ECF transporter T component CbiQ [Candidatus Nealsonbacteria bacterium]|nr:cobalt ECF transporter T component CbiQ [Candidatus Nealsonbacteria bacterium]
MDHSHDHHHAPPILGHSSLVTRPTCYLCSVDPRARLLVAVAFSVVVAVLLKSPTALWLALAVGIVAVAMARLRPMAVLKRLVPFNLLVLVLFLVLPLTKDGQPLVTLLGFDLTGEGFLQAGRIALKGNAILLTLMVMLGTLDVGILGHTLSHLRVPDKLTHLLVFTVRYLDVLHREYLRLAAAMKTRGFRPRLNRHTLATYGYLVGMLLVRSFDRAERIVAAMKCRGFRGRFYLLDHFSFSRRDVPFCVVSIVTLLALIVVQYT